MTQRLRGISDEEAAGTIKDIFDSSNKLLGRTANLLRILAHSPYLARWFLPFVAAVRQPHAGAVSDVACVTWPCSKPQLSTVAATERSTTGCLVKHWDSPTRNSTRCRATTTAGVLFSARARKRAMGWAEAMTLNTAKNDDAVWDETRRLFSDAEIVEISLAAGMFNMINRSTTRSAPSSSRTNTTAGSTARSVSRAMRSRIMRAACARARCQMSGVITASV